MIVLKIKKLENPINKSVGLLKAKKAYSIYFQTRFGIHTFFMRFSIDVVVLDQKFKVIKMAENLKPNKIFFWPPRFNKIIELPAGEIKRNKIKLGDTINLQFI